MFDLEKLKTGKCYVHLPTQELYDEAMEFLKENKLPALERGQWKSYHNETCISYYKHLGITTFGSRDIYINEGYKELPINEKEDYYDTLKGLAILWNYIKRNKPEEDNEVEAIVPLPKQPTNTNNMVKSPNHYIGELGLETEEVLRNFLPTYENSYVAHRIGSAVEYLLRSPRKNGLEDLKKAAYNIQLAIEYIEKRDGLIE